MKKVLIILCIFLPLYGFAQQAHQYTVSGTYVEYPEDPMNKQMEVYLINTTTVNISYVGMGSAPYQWYKYTTGTPGTPIPGATSAVLTNASADCGYYLMANGLVSKYIWLVNYTQSANRIQFQSLSVADANCEYVTLHPDMTVPDINYYTDKGSESSINRKYAVSYQTWDIENAQKKDTTEFLTTAYAVSAPLTDTPFTMYDVYARELGLVNSITSDEYAAIAVTAQGATAEVVEDDADADNKVPGPDGSLSAPARGIFTANANEPVAAFYVWSVYKTDVSTDNPLIRYTDRVLRYTFEESGDYEIRLDVSDRTSKCLDTKSFTYTITDFYLDVPNAFSPGATPGVNDEFKVAYRSVVSFKAWIFNRWGKELFYWTDPELGWNGKVGGKLVPPGVYFYIIEAKGSDEKMHTKKGHINILRGK